MTHIHISKHLWLCSTLIFAFTLPSIGQKDRNVSFLFVGDVMQHDGQIAAAYNATTQSYEYDDCFQFIEPIVNSYDVTIANLEVTLAGKPFKGYPQFSAPDELATALVDAGFNVILTANNHSCDRGKNGVLRTLDQLDALGVKHTGTFRNKQERDKNYPLIVQEKGMKIAVLNYTYGTNGLEVPAPLIINYIDSTVIKEDIAKAKSMNADYIICNMHWGTEYKPLPNPYQKTYEQVCYQAGADMVIGSHPHVVQPVEKKTVHNEEKLTVWSLGNFISNMQTRTTRGGVMVGAKVEQTPKGPKLGEVNTHLLYVMKRREGATTPYYVLPDFPYNNYRPDFMSSAEAERMKLFFSDSRKLYAGHNKNVQESIVAVHSETGKHFQKLLTHYFAVEILAGGTSALRNSLLGHYLHKHVDAEGGVHYLSGFYYDSLITEGHMRFLNDCGIENTQVVEVTPTTILKKEE